ncbi:SCO family protein [Leptospira sp. 201903070]|uniref:SCO family protein n=1 Tax=Leptospira ainlahdjerensis TaxID=2810033 RepID=A0ABS2U8M2_9LEPT|nr:SCO family protein [Leptospira ainlahdjerensis]MBM9576124.1 SCO family protein [Leptospira ainlahdjerensis]
MNYRSIISKFISVSIILVCFYFVFAANPFVIGDLKHPDSGLKVDRELPKFKIRNAEGFFISDSDLQIRKYLIYFAYGECKSVCRTGLSKLETFFSKEEFKSWGFVLISLSPKEDREKQSWMRKYLSRWKRQPILLLPEDRQEAERIAGLFQVAVSKGTDDEILHRNPLFITDDNGRIRIVYPDLSVISEESFRNLEAKIH